jgi:hypothetical protein
VLARLAANEQDPEKLLAIVEELNQALEDRENQLRGKPKRPRAPKQGATGYCLWMMNRAFA